MTPRAREEAYKRELAQQRAEREAEAQRRREEAEHARQRRRRQIIQDVKDGTGLAWRYKPGVGPELVAEALQAIEAALASLPLRKCRGPRCRRSRRPPGAVSVAPR